MSAVQVYPPLENQKDSQSLTRLQERLIKKLGANAMPFCFEVCILIAFFPLQYNL